MKKSIFISICLLLAILAPQMVFAYTMPTDVPQGTYYYEPVRQALDQGILRESVYFYPAQKLTRARFVDWYVSALQLEMILPEKPSFSDVSKTYWAYGAIETAKQYGLVSGTADANGVPTGKFEPSAYVNRAQAAVIIMKAFMHLTEEEKEFPDMDNVPWAVTAIRKAATAGFFAGYPDGTYGPAKGIQRSEGITVFMKIYNMIKLKQLGTKFENE